MFPQEMSGVAVFDFDDLDLFRPARGAQRHHVADAGLHQRARHRRDPAHLALLQPRLVDADDADGALAPLLVGIGHRGAEEYLLAVLLQPRIDRFGDLQPLQQEADAAVDLAQPLLAVEIVAVLRAVAVAGRPGDDLDHLRPLNGLQMAQLVLQPAQALGRDVVLRARRYCRRGVLAILVVGGVVLLAGEGFAHQYTCTSCPGMTRASTVSCSSAAKARQGRARKAGSGPAMTV